MISHLYNNSEDFFSSRITKVSFSRPEWRLNGGGLFFVGSCFANNLFTIFDKAEIDSMIAPFGNIYNPMSIAEAAKIIEEGGGISEKDCFQHDNSYRHFMFHSQKNDKSAIKLVEKLNNEIAEARKYLSKAEAVVITLGTSLVYRLKEYFSDYYSLGRVVNNCHKLPAETFSREQISINEAASALKTGIESFLKINPKLKIILTLSPVRHLRDNATENSLSKAVLRTAIYEAEKIPNLWYFPSYEIMLDELRDYRWYADDLCHPSTKAIEYIISVFINSACSPTYLDFLKRWFKLRANLEHKPLNPDSETYKSFLAETMEKIRLLKLERST